MIGEDGRKADAIFTGQGRDNTNLAADYTIGSATSNSYLQNSAYISKYVLTLLEDNKITKYAAGYRNIGVDFLPLSFEMLGEVSDRVITFFKKLVAAAADVTDIHYSILFNYWKKRISTTMQKYNAKILHIHVTK